MSRFLALDNGSAAEQRALSEPRYRSWLSGTFYTGDPDVSTHDGQGWADDVAGVWVPEGTPRRRLLALAPRLGQVLARGGAVLFFGDQQAGWPPGTDWSWRPAGGAGQTVLPTDAHGFAARVGDAAVALHHHGVLTPPPLAEVLLATPDGAAVAYLDQCSTPGSIFVSTLDPLAHFGTYEAPDAARFLDAFLPWASDVLISSG